MLWLVAVAAVVYGLRVLWTSGAGWAVVRAALPGLLVVVPLLLLMRWVAGSL